MKRRDKQVELKYKEKEITVDDALRK